MENANNKKVTAFELSRKLAISVQFATGYLDYMQGKPFDYSMTTSSSYERGRCFGIFTKQSRLPKATWRKGRMSKAATGRLVMAFHSGYLR